MLLLKILFHILLIAINLNKAISDEPISTLSGLNKLELESFTYQIDIDKSIRISSQFKNSNNQNNKPTNQYLNNNNINNDLNENNFISLKNIHGQSYECYLPDDDSFDETNYEGSYDTNDYNSGNLKPLKSSSQFNFTLINEKVKKVTQNLKDSNQCIYRNLGWWTYELCFGSHAYQYHLLNNGSILGEKINLGNFTSDFDWLNANKSNIPISSGILYHEQYFEMGSICELNKKPRRTVAKIFCDETSSTSIDLISEIETCVYEIHVNSRYLCNIPNFTKKPTNFNINCHPVLDPLAYENYKRKQEQLIQIRNENNERIKKEKAAFEKAAQNENDFFEFLKQQQEQDPKLVERDLLGRDILNDLEMTEFSSTTTDLNHLFTQDDLFKKNDKTSIDHMNSLNDLISQFEAQTEEHLNSEINELSQLSKDGPYKELESSSLSSITDKAEQKSQLQDLNEQIKQALENNEKKIQSLKQNALKFESIVNEVKKNRENGLEVKKEKIDKAKELYMDTLDNYLKTDKALDKVTDKITKLIHDVLSTPLKEEDDEDNDDFDEDELGEVSLNEKKLNKNKPLAAVADDNSNKKVSQKIPDLKNRFDLENTDDEKLKRNFDDEKDDLTNELVKNILNEKKASTDSNTVDENRKRLRDEDGDDAKNRWKMKVNILDSTKASLSDQDEKTKSTSNDKIKNLEKSLAEKLSKSDKLAKKFKTTNFKVKIITYDPTQFGTNGLKTLSEEDSDGFNSLISALFEDEYEAKKLKRLESNYDYVHDNNKIKLDDDEQESNQNNYEVDENHQDDDNSKLIIY